MRVPNKKAFRSGLGWAGLMAAFGLIFLFQAHHAAVNHTIIPPGSKHSWMTPQEGYIVAFMFFALAGYAIVLAFRYGQRL
jgi:hypothetical protein